MRLVSFICIIILLLLISACSFSVPTNKHNNEEHSNIDNEENYEERLIEENTVLEILKKEMGSLQEYQKISLLKLSDKYILVELLSQEVLNPWEVGILYIIDTENLNLKLLQIGVGDVYCLKVKSFKDNILTLYNHVTQQNFPQMFKYNVVTGEESMEPYYADIWEQFKIGADHKLGLKQVDLKEETIYFSFKEEKGTELFGGLHAPTIEIIGSADKFLGKENVFAVDFHSVHLTNDLTTQIKALEAHKNIKEINIKEYSDGLNQNHVVFLFELEGVNKYTCSFADKEFNNDHISDFLISFVLET